MPDPIDPLRPVKADRRRSARRQGDPVPAARDGAAGSTLPVVQSVPPTAPTEPDPGPSAFAAQLLGQSGQKRGLRGGVPVLDAARSAYLGAEWSGRSDRRPPRGGLAKTRI